MGSWIPSFLTLAALIDVHYVKTTSPPTWYNDECETWLATERVLENLPEGHLKCDTHTPCVGINCTGSYESYTVNGDIRLYPCTDPITVGISASIPDIGVYNWQHNFTHGEKIPVPGAGFATSLGQIDGFVEINLIHLGGHIGLGIALLGRLTVLGQPTWPILINVMKNQTVRVPPCLHNIDPIPPENELLPSSPVVVHITKHYPQLLKASNLKVSETDDSRVHTNTAPIRSPADGTCSMSELYNCPPLQVCVQTIEGSSKGKCQCSEGYNQSSTGECVVITTPAPANKPANGSDSHQPRSSSNVVKEVVVPLLAPLPFIVIGIFLYFAYKHRVVHRLRARFMQGVRSYEEVIIDGHEEDNNSELAPPELGTTRPAIA